MIDNSRTSFIKDGKNYLISVREYDDGFSDFKSAKEQVEVVWKKLEARELSGTDKQKTSHLLKPKNWRTMINAGTDREKDKSGDDSGPDGKSAPICALQVCNKPCPWDDKGKKWWKFFTPAHLQKAKEQSHRWYSRCPGLRKS